MLQGGAFPGALGESACYSADLLSGYWNKMR